MTERIVDTNPVAGSVDASAAKVAVEVGGGATTYENAKTLESNLNSLEQEGEFDKNDTTGTSLTQSQLPDLYNSTDTYKWAGTTYTATFKEKIDVTVNPKYNTVPSVKALTAEIGVGGFGYLVDLGGGIPVTESSSSSTAFSDGTNDNILIPFFGKKYLVKDVDVNTSGSEWIKLVEANAKTTLLPGESVEVEGKGTYVDKTLTLEMELLSSSGSSARFNLRDGDTLLQSVTQGTGDLDFTDSAGNDIMDTAVTVDSITATGSNTTTGVTNGYVDVFVGSSGLELHNNKGYPYDSSNATGIYDWKVTFTTTTGTSGKLTKIKILNSQKRWDGTNSLRVGESAEFASGGFSIKFNGWKDDKTFTNIAVGNNLVTFKDTAGQTHNVPMAIGDDSSLTTTSSTAAAGTYTNGSFAFDGKTAFYDSNGAADCNVYVATGTKVNGRTWTVGGGSATDINVTVSGVAPINDVNVGQSFVADGVTYNITQWGGGNIIKVSTDACITLRKTSATGDIISSNLGATAMTATDANAYTRIFLTGDTVFDANSVNLRLYKDLDSSNSSDFYTYVIRYNKTGSYANRLIFMLAADQNLSTEFSGNSKKVGLAGTDTGEDLVVDTNYYKPDKTITGGSESDTTYYMAKFRIDEGGATVGAADSQTDANIFIDTGTGKLMEYNTNLSNYAYPVDYNNYRIATSELHLGGNTAVSTYYADAYADSGTHIWLDSGIAKFSIPETRPYITATIKTSGTTESISGGEAGILEVGKTITIGTTKIRIADANAISGLAVTGADGGTGETVTVLERAPLNNKAQVVLDSADPGAAILIGGQKVNRLTSALGTAISSKLAKSGDTVVEKVDNKIVVAGYTAADTGTAARELITWLDTQ
ncbi:MAG TPA: hypothetical protein HA222_00205 [Candidatus Diapherotrites archaeon]|uniref:S-layer protein n=1 Tax=Candidatus Iainarchaeum sp. TaxID=3101447 RepID=A0A7J4JTE9_9ARCH|nr:hypothetical protein [Candidatus Diapherotrites archaeon]